MNVLYVQIYMNKTIHIQPIGFSSDAILINHQATYSQPSLPTYNLLTYWKSEVKKQEV